MKILFLTNLFLCFLCKSVKSFLHSHGKFSVFLNPKTPERCVFTGDDIATIIQSTSAQKLKQTVSNVIRFIRTTNYSLVFLTVLKFVSIREVAVIAAFVLYHKKLLLSLYSVEKKLGSIVPEYGQSIFGYLEHPISFIAHAVPIIYIFDLLLIAMQYLGVNYVQITNVERISKFLITWFLVGSFTTRVKDWLASKRRLIMCSDNSKRDPVKEQLTDDITSSVIWIFIVVGFLESLHLPIERLGSILALGWLSSTTLLNALRPLCENAVGGLLLRLQDKFRVGETISLRGGDVEGSVEEITPLNTRIRREDNSYVSVPNKVFMECELVNWSR